MKMVKLRKFPNVVDNGLSYDEKLAKYYISAYSNVKNWPMNNIKINCFNLTKKYLIFFEYVLYR